MLHPTAREAKMAGRFAVLVTAIYFFAASLFLSLPTVDAVADVHDHKDTGQGQVRQIVVDCSQGSTLGQALRSARAGDSIVVTGTCHEKVTITVDRLTLDGQGTAIIDGTTTACDLGPFEEVVEGLVEIDAAQGVVLTGLTVQNSPGDGIVLRNGAAASIRDTTVQHSCDDGIHLTQSVATLERTIFQENQENGMNVFDHSAVSVASGSVAFINNGRFGVQNQNSGVSVYGGASLKASHNGFIGVAVFAAGRVIAFTGSAISVNNNAVSGVLLLDGGLHASFATIEVFNNGSRNTPDSSGMTLVDGAVFAQTGGSLRVERNQPVGLVAENSTVSLRLLDAQAVTIEVLALRFGARATLIGTIAPILCDNTVLIQGEGQQCSQGSTVLSQPSPQREPTALGSVRSQQ
jgi:hypothetical protein